MNVIHCHNFKTLKGTLALGATSHPPSGLRQPLVNSIDLHSLDPSSKECMMWSLVINPLQNFFLSLFFLSGICIYFKIILETVFYLKMIPPTPTPPAGSSFVHFSSIPGLVTKDDIPRANKNQIIKSNQIIKLNPDSTTWEEGDRDLGHYAINRPVFWCTVRPGLRYLFALMLCRAERCLPVMWSACSGSQPNV